MRFTRPALACAALFTSALVSLPALAAPATAPAAKSAAAAPGKPAAPENMNPLIASVNGQDIHLDDVRKAAVNLPPQARQIPQDTLIGLLVNQLIDQKAIEIVARKEGVQNQPEVKDAMEHAANTALQNAYLQQKVTPLITDAAIEARYKSEYESKKGEVEIHARHILVATEAEAKDIISQLKKGADFAALAKKLSTDKGSGASGGDLGWFKKGDMLPAFSDAAFAMKPNTISQTPVKTQYGYHVIQVLGSRPAPVPPMAQVKDQIRQELVREDVSKVVAQAKSEVKIVHYDAQGKPVADTPAPAAPAAKP
ncbi:peptidylprolyl isomerase [Acidomonas methanolica]|uniref:peptidylprolyl isomerase n=1 Tax=Acidomonas methanolica TaxID=437 RepID=UPI002119C772|nr:peptidylprolyl isomerase [Acidomonas methanolica]MCQ9154327.1 peptidylprolyl isomerase [Acidomonas methanolica]